MVQLLIPGTVQATDTAPVFGGRVVGQGQAGGTDSPGHRKSIQCRELPSHFERFN